MKKEHYIRLKEFKSVIIAEEDKGLTLSVHVPGGHLMVSLDANEALKLIVAVDDIINYFHKGSYHALRNL